MMRRRSFVAGAAAFLVAGPLVPARPARAATDPAWFDIWERVLVAYVDTQGRVAFESIQKDPAPLHGVVDAIAATAPFNRPELFPSAADRIAFWINAYNALSMWGVVQRGIPQRFDLLDRWSFFVHATQRIGGRDIALNPLETDIIRPIGEERVHFALNCMVRDCPRLPREAFRAARLEAQLDAAARLFCTDGRTVRPDPARGTIWLSEIFQFYTEDFVPRKAPNLIAYVNRWRTSPLAEDANVRFLPYDWTINRQPPAPT